MANASPASSLSTADDCRIIIVACSAVIRDLMACILENALGFQIVATAANGQCGSNPGICSAVLPLSEIGAMVKKITARTGA